MGRYSWGKIKEPSFPDSSTLPLTGHPPPISWISYNISADFTLCQALVSSNTKWGQEGGDESRHYFAWLCIYVVGELIVS